MVAAIALGACSNSGSDGGTTTTSERSVAAASAPGALQEPGTEIADGVHVQDGSALVGVAFPSLHIDAGLTDPKGWDAVVAVQGDPIEVWDAYAAELGIDDVAGAKDACIVQADRKGDGDEPYDASETQRFLTEPALDDELRLWCHARIGSTEVSMASGVVGCVRPNVSDDPCELRSGSSMFIQRARDEGGESLEGDALGTDDLRVDRAIPDGEIVPPDLQGTGPSNLPGAGERIDDGIDPYLGTSDEEWVAEAAILPDGAESAVAPAMLIDCNSGLVAVVSMPEEPADAVAAFAADDEASDIESGELGSRSWATRFFDSAGGYKLQITAVDGDEPGSSFVLATECGD